jgi:hypothetical protein
VANNTILNLGSGGDTIVTIDLANFASFGYPTVTGKLPATCLYVSQASGTSPTALTTSNTLPVSQVGALPAGANTIGNVGLVAGSAAVGTVATNADAAIGAGAAPSKALVIAGVFNTSAPAPGNGQTVGLQTDIVGNLYVSNEGRKPTYSACSESFTLAAAPTDIAILVASTTKIVKIVRIAVTVQASAAQTQVFPILLIKRSAANTGANSSMNIVPHDSNDAAGSATAAFYTANPTPGTKTGSVATTWQTTISNPASSGANGALTRWEYLATDKGAKPITLKKNTAEQIAVNLGATALTGAPTAMVEFEWTEE